MRRDGERIKTQRFVKEGKEVAVGERVAARDSAPFRGSPKPPPLGVDSLLVSVSDLAFFQKDIYNAPVFIVFITVIATTLTTAVGVVIGSSID